MHIRRDEREATEPWTWPGRGPLGDRPRRGGCLEVIEWVLTAGRFPLPSDVVQGGVLNVETSKELRPAHNVAWIVRSLRERGILGAVDAVLVATRPGQGTAARRTA